jgi:hypothetical protein
MPVRARRGSVDKHCDLRRFDSLIRSSAVADIQTLRRQASLCSAYDNGGASCGNVLRKDVMRHPHIPLTVDTSSGETAE